MAQIRPISAALQFNPDLGPLESRLRVLARQLAVGGSISVTLDRAALVAREEADGRPGDQRLLRWAFAVSVLADIAAAGGTVLVVDSNLLVSWPDWSRPDARVQLRSALERLRNEDTAGLTPIVAAALPRSLLPRDVAHAVEGGIFRLREASAKSPAINGTYQEIYRALRQYWTMPNRDREGRNRCFVLTCETPGTGVETPAGILEASDGPPFSSHRDQMLGLTGESFLSWIAGRNNHAADLQRMVSRFKALRKALLPVRGINTGQARILYQRWRDLDALARGRSVDGERLNERKRLAYLVRLVRGEHALNALLASRDYEPSDLGAGLRVLQNLTIPRVHLEISVCGAVPPFSVGLVGKLISAFFADPRIVALCTSPPGEILRRVFDSDMLQKIVPAQGTILITTLGLYPHHSAQYERAQIPGRDVPLQLRRIGETAGETTSLISRRTYELSQRVLDAAEGGQRVAGEFGTGGSKRQRRIEVAARIVGLPEELIHPRTPRPIYAVSLVNNLREVTLLGATPQWRIAHQFSADQYATEAVALWRRRWLPAVSRRLEALSPNDFVEGTFEWFERRGMLHA